MPLAALPTLTEKRGLDATLINGTAADRLTTTGDQTVKASFVTEDAGFLSSLVAYEVAADGTLQNTQIVFAVVDGPDRGGGPLSGGETVELGTYAAGTRLGLALLQDAASKGIDLADGTLEFRAADGSPANIADSTPPSLYLVRADGSETEIDVPIFHTADSDPADPLANSLNPAGAEHTVSAVDADGNVVIAFEDVVSTAKNFDGDYNDAVFKIAFGSASGDGEPMPPVTEPEPPVTDPVTDPIPPVSTDDPTQAVDSSPVTLPDGQEVALGITTEAETSDDTAELSGVLSLSGFLASNFNIAYIIDSSGSTTSLARDGAGQPIDIDGDGQPDRVLQAEQAAFAELNQQLIDGNLGNADLGVIDFDGTARTVAVTSPAADNNGDGTLDAVEAINSVRGGGSTNFGRALQEAIDFFNDQDDVDSATNVAYFLSDGRAFNNFAAQIAELQDPNGIDAIVNAFGAGTGTRQATLDLIDNTGGAEIFTDLSQLAAGLTGSSLSIDDILSVDINVNGVTQATLDETAFSNTATGLQFGPVTLTGLDPTAVNTIDIEAVLETDDGQMFDLVVQTEIVGTAAPAPASTSAPTSLDTLVSEPEPIVA